MEMHHGDDLSYFPTPPLSLHHFSSRCSYVDWDYPALDQFQETDSYHLSLVDMFLSHPRYTQLDYFPNDNHLAGLSDSNVSNFDSNLWKEQKRGKKSTTSEEKESKKLSREMISKCFYMPIAEAGKELKVGVTLLKRRCRELGIRRWPHRKLISLQTLINNLKETGKEVEDETTREAIKLLEQEKRMVEEDPDIELEKNTKRLRQACFKANFKKKRVGRKSSSTINTGPKIQDCGGLNVDDEKDEELELLLSQFALSSADIF